MSKIYLVERDDTSIGYDEYDSFVVVAKSPEQIYYDYIITRLDMEPEPKPPELYLELGRLAYKLKEENNVKNT